MRKGEKLYLFLYVFLFVILFSLSISFVSANQLKVTQEHPFLINGEWIPASELKVGDNLTTIEGKNITIKKISDFQTSQPFLVYNLEDDFGINNFVVGEDNIVVHNSGRISHMISISVILGGVSWIAYETPILADYFSGQLNIMKKRLWINNKFDPSKLVNDKIVKAILEEIESSYSDSTGRIFSYNLNKDTDRAIFRQNPEFKWVSKEDFMKRIKKEHKEGYDYRIINSYLVVVGLPAEAYKFLNSPYHSIESHEMASNLIAFSKDLDRGLSERQKIKEIYRKLQTNMISYPFDSAITPGFRMVLEKRQGVCRDKSLILANMLSAAGIKSEMLASSSHAFVRIKLESGEVIYLDPMMIFNYVEFSQNDINYMTRG